MNIFQRIQKFFDDHFSWKQLVPFMLFLLSVFLLMQTWAVWQHAFELAMRILLPFIIGFALAYIVRPIAVFFEKYNIKRAISVPITLVLFVVLIVLLFSSILPSLYTDISQLIGNSMDGIQQLYNYYKEINHNNPSPWADDIFKQVMGMLNGIVGQIPTLPAAASQFLSKIFSTITTGIFSFIIGMYFVFDYENFTGSVLRIANNFSPKLGNSIIVIDHAVSRYLGTLVVIMTITCIEYSLLYLAVGHNYAFVLGVLTAFGLLIPYIGPTVVHVLGILTALTLPLPRVIILTIGLVILSNVDGYVVSPMVYSKRDKIEPLWSLFAFFASSVLFGFVGILISMPLYFSIRALFNLRKNNWVIPEEN
ncbi:AI-2E family transporter [Erysipelothrix rhusiopathiae]|nr:AI-2E family transporter [Erysipelothrix rhusiopathiae]MDE8078391.1 AI-2E family transporter [Erysipelothrix rhusiopathiae]MDE8083495.1 AI-2E family transporter [Erysipelothrix rhusiopathiae]MDE8093928.1 AI-2E family transporter [Erysipelothrix rhusiopathiae]MDE8160388.1 AI-2E family transporter [Erysipelothrix rhusiopathiae]